MIVLWFVFLGLLLVGAWWTWGPDPERHLIDEPPSHVHITKGPYDQDAA